MNILEEHRTIKGYISYRENINAFFQKALYIFVLSTLIVNAVFTDLPFIPEKTVTHSFMFIFAPVLFVIVFTIQKFKLKTDKVSKIFLIYILASFTSSVFMFMIFIFKEGDTYIYNRNLFLKLFEALFTLSLLNFFVYYLFYRAVINLELKHIKIILNITFVFLIIAGILEYLNPEILEIFHIFPKDYSRLRLFSSEPSNAIIVFSTVSFLVYFFTRSLVYKVIIFLIYLLGCIFISSKGIFISMIIAVAILTISKAFNVKNTKQITLILFNFALLFIIIALFLIYILPSLISDILYFTSFITRFSAILSVIYILFYFPLGLGYGTYLYFYPDILAYTANLLVHLIGMEFNLSEIVSIVETGENVGGKSVLATTVMVSGWQGLIFFLFLLRRTLNNIKKLVSLGYENNMLKFFTWTIFIQLFIGTELLYIYIIFLYISIFESLSGGNKK